MLTFEGILQQNIYRFDNKNIIMELAALLYETN
jgi:hypothetical protein